MNLIQLLEYGEQINKIAVDKGFWEDGANRNKGEMIMLVITELSEAVEAHRKGRVFIHKYWPMKVNCLAAYLDGKATSDDPQVTWEGMFKKYVKDTVEDEIADAVIRLLDYIQGFEITVVLRDYWKESTGNFANDSLRLVHYVLNVYYGVIGRDWGYVLSAILAFCEWYNIDLEQHIQWKLKYNSTRPYKHGKTY